MKACFSQPQLSYLGQPVMLLQDAMSKAFTRESDDETEAVLLPPPPAPLPPGVKNYITRAGFERLNEELKTLTEEVRPSLAERATDDSSDKSRLAALDQRISYLGQSLQSAVVVAPSMAEDNVVRFGSTVTLRDRRGETVTYRLVGVDETDLDRDWISWRSPVASAALNHRVGEKIRVRLPGGMTEYEILSVSNGL
jgi:transcription elongation factor GreB